MLLTDTQLDTLLERATGSEWYHSVSQLVTAVRTLTQRNEQLLQQSNLERTRTFRALESNWELRRRTEAAQHRATLYETAARELCLHFEAFAVQFPTTPCPPVLEPPATRDSTAPDHSE